MKPHVTGEVLSRPTYAESAALRPRGRGAAKIPGGAANLGDNPND
ncbi:MAG: hypothetical protein ACYCU8_11455 [Ferrimicrobium acidiphilum]|nr:hypothetical protein [Ferrimicrobium sp.]